MVMEYLQGHDLSFYTRSGRRFSVAEAIDFVVQACEALAHAHKAGIIHRDIKPANLFLAQYEERQNVKVLDFGISKVLDDEPQEMSLTKTTTVLGSGLYMSPEQMRSAKNVDIRTDIYSLGICLFELLTGTQPFTADTFSELCVKVNIDPPTPLRTYRPDISDDLAAVIAKAYARSVDDRYQSVQQLVAALAPYAAPTSTGTIHHVQGITRAEGRQPSVPPPPLAAVAATVGTSPEIRPAPPHALAGTAGALTASREAAPKAKPIGILVSVAVAALVAAGVAGVMLMRGNDDKAVGSDSARAAPSSAQPTAERSAPPAASSTIVASAEPSASSASPSPSSSASTKAAGSSRPPPLPPPVRSQTASAAPPLPPPPVNLKCFKTNPVTGLKEPCL
jgi:serine/threonine-protein kinase